MRSKYCLGEYMINFGKTIRRRRKMLDMTQEELARRSGVSVATIRRWEKGHGMTVESAELVLDALGAKLAVTDKGGLRT